jgi:hypothetical protein
MACSSPVLFEICIRAQKPAGLLFMFVDSEKLRGVAHAFLLLDLKLYLRMWYIFPASRLSLGYISEQGLYPPGLHDTFVNFQMQGQLHHVMLLSAFKTHQLQCRWLFAFSPLVEISLFKADSVFSWLL